MKCRMTITIALVLCVALFALVTSDSTTAQTQRGHRWSVADTGMIPLGFNQSLRLAVTPGNVDGNDYLAVRFRPMEYVRGTCDSSGVCKYAVSSQTSSDRIMLSPGEAAVFEVGDGLSNTLMGVRGVVETNRPGAKITAQIIGPTGEVVSQIIMANTEGDFH